MEYQVGKLYEDEAGVRWTYEGEGKWKKAEKPKVSAGERFLKNTMSAIDTGVGALTRAGEEFFAPDSNITRVNKAISLANRAEYEAMPSFTEEEGILSKLGHGAAALGGQISGSFLQPENTIPVGKSWGVLKTMAGLGGINVATDPLYQAADIYSGVQDKYDPMRTLVSGAAGAGLGGVLGGIGKWTDNIAAKRAKSAEEAIKALEKERIDELRAGLEEGKQEEKMNSIDEEFAKQDLRLRKYILSRVNPENFPSTVWGEADGLAKIPRSQEVLNRLLDERGKPKAAPSDDMPTGRDDDDIDPDEVVPEGYTDAGLRIVDNRDEIGTDFTERKATALPKGTYSEWIQRWREDTQAQINVKQAELDEINLQLEAMRKSSFLDEDDYALKDQQAAELESDINTLKLEQKDFETSYRSFVMEKLKDDVNYELTTPLVSKVISNWENTKAAKGDNLKYWDLMNELTYLGKSPNPNKNNLKNLWRQTKAERTPVKPFGKIADIDIRPMVDWIEKNLPENLGDGKTRSELLNYIRQTFGGLVAPNAKRGVKVAEVTTAKAKLSDLYPDTRNGFANFLRQHGIAELGGKPLASPSSSRPTVSISNSIDERIAQLVQGWQELLGFADPRRLTKLAAPMDRALTGKFDDINLNSKQVVIISDKDITPTIRALFPDALKEILERNTAATNYAITRDLDLIVMRQSRRGTGFAPEMEAFVKAKIGDKATPDNINFMRDLYTLTHEYAHSLWRSLLSGLHQHTWKNESAIVALKKEFVKWVQDRQGRKMSASEYLKQAATHPRLQSAVGEDAERLAVIFGKDLGVPGANTADEWRTAFKEFLAEQTTRKLLSKKFEKETPLGSIANRIRALFETTSKYIKNVFGVDIPTEKFVDDYLNNHMQKAQEVYDATARSVYDLWSSAVFNKKSKYTPETDYDDSIPIPLVNKYPVVQSRFKTPEEALIAQRALKNPDISPLSGKALSTIFGAPTWIRMIAEKSPFLNKMMADLWDIEQKYKMNELDMLLGEIDFKEWDASGHLMTRFRNKKGIREVFKLENKQLIEVMQAFHEGSKARRPYKDTFNKYSSSWTDDQKLAFLTAATYAKRMWKTVTDQQLMSNKKVLPYHEGWFPTFRGGKYVLIVTDPATGLPQKVYTTYTKLEARKARKYLDKQGIKYTFAENDNPTSNFMEPSMEATVRYLRNVVKNDKLADELEKVETSMAVTYGTFGKHHEIRTDVGGFWGDRPWRTVSENADDFRHAFYNSIGEYMRFAMRTEMIRTYQPVLDDMKSKGDLPNLASAAETYYNRAVGIMPEPLTKLDKVAEKFASYPMEIPYIVPFNREQPAWTALTNGMSQIFYLINLISKPSFWVSQATSPMLAWRAVDRLWAQGEGGMTGVEAYARSWWAMQDLDPDLRRALYWAATKTETFNPQFVQDMHRLNFFDNRLMLGDKGRKIGDGLAKVTDILTGQKMSEMGDSWSRFQTFVMMHEALKKKGLSGEELWRKAAMETDAAMVSYRTSSRPPVYGAMGSIGEAIAPLTTFGHGMSGNVYGDVVHAIKYGGRNPKFFIPILSTVASSFLLAGMAGMPLLLEYELLAMGVNKLAEGAGIDFRLPSLLQWAMTTRPFESTIANDTLIYGAMSGASSALVEGGVDIGASQRYQPFLNRYIEGMGNIGAIFPAMGFGVDLAKFGTTIVRDSMWEETGFGKPVPTAEYNNAVRSMMPGWTKGLVDSNLIGRKSQGADYEEVTHSKGMGYGGVVKGEGEKLAPYLGVRSMNQVKSAEAIRRSQQAEQKFTTRKQEWAQMYADAWMEQNGEKQALAQQKLMELGATPDMLFEIILQAAYKRNTPATDIYAAGKLGKPSLSNSAIRKQMELDRWLQEE